MQNVETVVDDVEEDRGNVWAPQAILTSDQKIQIRDRGFLEIHRPESESIPQVACPSSILFVFPSMLDLQARSNGKRLQSKSR